MCYKRMNDIPKGKQSRRAGQRSFKCWTVAAIVRWEKRGPIKKRICFKEPVFPATYIKTKQTNL